ncbi:MAG: Bax inhibitor-1 family protein [Saccharospirillaceae bacterium]|nr:Bax inhibitor-1 family protein [Pseudomonadales bacterium]NRB79844.1 Bax inhibitor-1 family protein [Saccharospirillaceae bacterium]
MSNIEQTYSQNATMSVDVPKLLRNTYSLLACTFVVSAFAAFISTTISNGFLQQIQADFLDNGQLDTTQGLLSIYQYMGLGFMIPAIALLWFVIPRTANSGKGIFFTFIFAALMGAGLGPMLSSYLGAGKGEIIAQALGGTALIFFGLSAYALTTKKDFSYLSGFLMTGGIVLMVAVVANLFLHIPALQIAISCAFMVFSSACILFYTSSAIKGGETNYIMLTVGLYLAIYNLFVSLLSILGIFGGDD